MQLRKEVITWYKMKPPQAMDVELRKGRKNLDSGKELSQNIFEVSYSSTFHYTYFVHLSTLFTFLNLTSLSLYGDGIEAHQIVELNAIM